jgi:hypothetical protein
LAGAGGFEPPYGGTKIRCLTTWLRPNVVTVRRRAGILALEFAGLSPERPLSSRCSTTDDPETNKSGGEQGKGARLGKGSRSPPNSISGMLNDPSGCAAPKWLAPLHGGRHEFAPDSSLEGPGFETSVPPATVSSVVALVARLAARDRAPKRTPRFSPLPSAVRGPIPDVGRAPGRSGHGVEQRLCFLSPISGASPPNRCWPTLLPTSPERTSSSTAASSIYIHVLALGIASAAASFRRQRLSVRPYPARTCRTGPRRRYRNNLSDCGPSRSCTRHRGYFPMRPVPTEDPAP